MARKKVGLAERIFCQALGWHTPGEKWGFDGCSASSRCERCGSRILLDSQGNWFAISGGEKDNARC